ncbi:MAG: RNA polymerase sigma factor [Oligoflexia bacterium]|nr:RNA polymerase sigma factor [Oligoflexia bacterium]
MDQISKQLIEKIKQRNVVAFRFLYDATIDYVYSISLGVLHNTEDAQEAVQETYIKIYKKIKNFKTDSNIRVWIFKIALNTSLDLYRKRKSYTAKILSFITDTLFDRSTDDSANREIRDTAQKIMAGLSEEERNLIVLSAIEGLTFEEISEITNINVNTIKTKLRRMRERLGGAYDEQIPVE